ncbi:MAG: 3-methyl-2-oxobutanoate hydroxymethyltransferase [Arenicella sp.]
MNSVTVATLRKQKETGDKITCLTAYDYSFGALLDRNGVDMVLVGDSLGMVMQGHSTPVPVSIEDCIYHTKCVSRGVNNAMIIGDLPFGSYQVSKEQALQNSVRLMQEGGAQIIKYEGGEHMVEVTDFLTTRGIAVCGHIGLTPQSVNQFGGFKVQGRGDAGQRLLDEAISLEQAGVSLLILEAIPAELAAKITSALSIPTIGIGAGPQCDGQVLVLQDMLGIYPGGSPKFSKNYMQSANSIDDAVANFVKEVKSGAFPEAKHSFS